MQGWQVRAIARWAEQTNGLIYDFAVQGQASESLLGDVRPGPKASLVFAVGPQMA